MAESADSQFVLLEDSSTSKGGKGPRANWQKRHPHYSSEGPLTIKTKANTDLNIKSTKMTGEHKVYFADEGEKENIPEQNKSPDQARKSRSVSKEGLSVACLLEQFHAEEPDKDSRRDTTPPRTPSTPQRPIRTSPTRASNYPQTPPRQSYTPQSKPPRAGTPRKSTSSMMIPCTPPQSRMTHNPYYLRTPPPYKSPASKQSPVIKASPKARTPSRTRLLLQKQNTPSPGISPHFSMGTTPQHRLSMAILGGTPNATPARSEAATSHSSPIVDRLQGSLPMASQFLQYSTTAESQPPSLQVTSPFGAYDIRGSQDERMQYGYSPQYASLSDLLQTSAPVYTMAQVEQAAQFPQLQRGSSPMTADYSSSPTAIAQYAAGISPAARYVTQLAPSQGSGSPASTQASPHGVMQAPAGYASPTTPPHVVNKIYMVVEFKRGRTVQFQSDFSANPGDYVLVEGDEGEDMGMVVNVWVAASNSPPVVNNSLNSNKASSGRDVDPVTGDPIYPKVIRQASAREVQYMHNAQAQAEMKCTEVAKHKVLEHQLMMTIVDAEYQFDRKKLTFYYDAGERVDFRDLIRDLYKLYRARIWMSKIRSHG